MSVVRSALKGMAWFAAASWLQLLLSLANFTIVVRAVAPEALGAFTAAILIAGLVETLLGAPLTQSLEQRASVDRRHIDATFWIGQLCALILLVTIAAAGRSLLAFMNAPSGWPILIALLLVMPISVGTGVLSALLSRDLRFPELGRIGLASTALGSIAGLAATLFHLGVWALVVTEITMRVVRMVGVARAARYLPGPPRDLAAIRDLMSFNMLSLLTYGLTFLDQAVPRFITSVVLGPASLGYLALSQRFLDMLSQLTLNPISRVMMASVARLEQDMAALQHLIRTIYKISTTLAYPAFLMAIMLAHNLVWLFGPQWGPALMTVQILLLVGLRTATGTFNFGILQGAGRPGGPPIILGCGLVIQVLLVPIGAQFGTAGVAAAIFVRTLATWPIGCWLVNKASGVSIREQLGIGTVPFAASLFMCAAIAVTDYLLAGQPSAPRLIACVVAGGISYAVGIAVLDRHIRDVAAAVFADLRRRDPMKARARLLQAIGF